MVTVTDGDNKNNAAPPPTYAQVVAGAGPAQPPPAPHVHFQPGPNGSVQPLLQQQAPPVLYGPTPIGAQTIPYYDARSEWALEDGARRARRRFFGALFWALIIYIGMAALAGGMVEDARWRRHHGRRSSY